MDSDHLRNIAKRVRKECEKFALSKKAIHFDFHGHDDLHCMCAFASDFLCKVLRGNGIRAEFICGYYDNSGLYRNSSLSPSRNFGTNHCWVEVGEYIIDITATQFAIKSKVRVIKKSGRHYYYGFYIGKTDGWTKRQSPDKKLIQEMTKKVLTKI